MVGIGHRAWRGRGGEPISCRKRLRIREAALTIEIHPQSISGPSLVRDYLRGEGDAGSFFGGSPFELESYRAKLREVEGRFGPAERRRAAAALRPTSARARERLERFVEQGGAVVTTGQQTGLFTGPLYTIYKAITTARLAERLEKALGVVVLPVFWAASEDHDWAEVNHAFLPLEHDGLLRVDLGDGSPLPLPMSERRLGEGVLTVVDEWEQAVAQQSVDYDLFMWVRGAYRPESTVATAFTELLSRLLAPLDFCLTDAADPHLKRASVPVLARAVECSREHEAVLDRRTREVVEAGYHAQVAILPAATNVFQLGPRGRERLYRQGGTVVGAESGLSLEPAGALERLAQEPGAFSPNVLLRPVVESFVFPTLCYVGGPGEISYFAQLTALFPEFGIRPPVVYPRGSLLLIEEPLRRVLHRLDLTPDQLTAPRHELVDRLARAAMPPEVRTALDSLGETVAEGYRALIERAGAIDPALHDALARLRNESLARVGESERKVVRQLKRRESDAIGRLDRLRAHLRPDGAPQDRVLNVLPYLARHGLGLIGRMAAAVEVDFGDADGS